LRFAHHPDIHLEYPPGGAAMKIQIGRWGNSLALRLPKAIVARLKLKEGDEIDATVIEEALTSADREARERRRQEALERIAQTRWPLPADYKFDREEANWRPAMDRW
jgi:antitoxin MazE